MLRHVKINLARGYTEFPKLTLECVLQLTDLDIVQVKP